MFFNSVLRIFDSELCATVKDGKTRKGQLNSLVRQRLFHYQPRGSMELISDGRPYGFSEGEGPVLFFEWPSTRRERLAVIRSFRTQSSTEHRQKTLRRPPMGQ